MKTEPDKIPMGTPKGCLLCHLVDSLGIASTCPGCGECSWAATAPAYMPEPELALEVVPLEEPPKPQGKGKRSDRR